MNQEIQLHYHTFPELLSALEFEKWKHLAEPVARWKAKQAEVGLINPPILGPLVVFGEAAGEPDYGQLAVIQVILNRAVRRYGAHIDVALLQPKQFACLNFNDPSLWRVKHVTAEEVKNLTVQFQEAVARFQRGESLSDVKDATIYMTTRCWEIVATSWARGSDAWDVHKMIPRGQVGRHVFFAEA